MRHYILLLMVLMYLNTYGQYYETGISFGAANYYGEFTEGEGLAPSEFNPVIGMFGRYNINRYVSAKVGLTKATVTGTDANSNDPNIRARNLNFRTNIVELAGQVEINLTPFAIREQMRSAPYLFVGVGGFHFNPQAQMRGNWYDLQPLGTEGQTLGENTKYSRYQMAIPFGIGFKMNLNNKVNFGFEFGARKTFTDYIDDVGGAYPDLEELRLENPIAAALSFRMPEVTGEYNDNPLGNTRGNAENQDWYFFASFSVSVNMTDKYGLDFDPKYDIFKNQ